MDESSLSHTRWAVNITSILAKVQKKRNIRKAKKDIGEILRELCEKKEVEIIEANACVEHIHMPVRIPPKQSVSAFMGFLKGKAH